MKTVHKPNLLTGILVHTLAATTSSAYSTPNMKMTPDMPASVTAPDIK